MPRRNITSKNIQVESVHEKVGFLKMELTVLSKLKEQDRLRHFCTIEDKGRHKDFFYIVMTMVGKSLQVDALFSTADQSGKDESYCIFCSNGGMRNR